ncbi:cellulose synthase operon protein YhjQ/BcsQ [Kozakia baliensis]|nr:cellulose synthase operon protein YhjQ/BcsQ [Kozakia baliensis]GBR34910.1 chromosome partitioning protein ParA [Kozakia baliensis NRIC 0488]
MPLICLASPKGGVGKSMLAANIAGQLIQLGIQQIIVIDLDPQNTLRLHFGIPLAQRNGIMAQIESPERWSKMAVRSASGVFVMPYGTMSFEDNLHLASSLATRPELLAHPLQFLASDPLTAVIVDTAPGPSTSLAAVLPVTDLLISVLAPDAASLVLMSEIKSGECYGYPANTTRQQKTLKHGVIVNQVDPLNRLAMTLVQNISSAFSSDLLGVVYRDEHVTEALAAQHLVHDYAPLSRAAADLRLGAQRVWSVLGGTQ